MPPIFYDDTLRPFAVGASADGTVMLTPAVVGKVLVSKRARNTGKVKMIRINSFIDRGER